MTDNERGLIFQHVVDLFSRSGTRFDPAAPKAPWQKGKAERKIEHIKHVMHKTIIHLQVLGPAR